MAAMVLLTGASGYIGSRLLRVLEEGGYAVRCLARQPERVAAARATTEVVAGDCLEEASLLAAMDGVDQAYYLVHSMASGPGFAALDRQAAANFGRAAARAGVRRTRSGRTGRRVPRSVVLPVLHGSEDARRREADSALAGHRAARRGHPEALRERRRRLPPAAAAGGAALGV